MIDLQPLVRERGSAEPTPSVATAALLAPRVVGLARRAAADFVAHHHSHGTL